MRLLRADEMRDRIVAALGLNSSVRDLTSTTALACALRRAACLLCPCPGRLLVGRIVESYGGLVGDLTEVRERLEQVLDLLISYGDLIECKALVSEGEDCSPVALIHLAAPMFVRRSTGLTFVLGVVADQMSPLPEDLEARVEYANHVRRLRAKPDENLGSELLTLGYLELPESVWLKQPSFVSAAHLIKQYDRQLDLAPRSGEISGLTVLDPARQIRYYRGRWRDPDRLSGRFVGRRGQLYGSDLWCYVQLDNGHPLRFVDLPIGQDRWRGCDEAWHLQAAIDAELGKPQECGFVTVDDQSLIEVFSPLPAWVTRRWDAVGEPVDRKGCLFAYSFDTEEARQELDYLSKHMWILPHIASGT